MKKRLAIIGASELGGLVKYYAEDSNEFIVVGFYDDNKKQGSLAFENPVLGSINCILNDFEANKFDSLFIAIGYNHLKKREELFNLFYNKIPFSTIIHRSSYVDKSVILGQGIIIFPGCIVDSYSEIKNNVLLNTGVSISHHSIIGDHCFLAPRISIAGRVTIGSGCFIGIGAIIKDEIKISNDCLIGAGSLVLNNTKQNQLVYGSPAKFIRNIV